MPVFRVEKTASYTVMSNYHLRDRRLSLKAKGLLSLMLSLPEDWDYTQAGLVRINREGEEAVRSAIHELENTGYLTRRQTVTEEGKFSSSEYIIHERPAPEKPMSENPITVNSVSENPVQLNKDIQSKEKQNIESYLSNQKKTPDFPGDRIGSDVEDEKELRKEILENIEYDLLREQPEIYQEDLDEIVEIMVETAGAGREQFFIAGGYHSQEMVKKRILSLRREHICYVMECLPKTKNPVRNMKKYIQTALFNAPTTMNNSCTIRVNQNLYGSSH